MARALIVDEFLGQNADWRHLALEDICDSDMEDMDDEDIFNFQTTFMTMIACECAKEARDAGHHIVITCPESDMLEGVYNEIDEEIISVYLGAQDEADGFDHIIDSASKSMVEISNHLNEIIEVTRSR